ncbi:hypothetical protein ACWEIJ_40990 [Lentzea sp. NPDC004789]
MTRFGLAVTAFGALWVGVADDPVTLLLTNLVLGAGLGVVYAAATAAAEDSDKASALAVGLLLDNAGAEVPGVVFAAGLVLASVPLLRMTGAAPLVAAQASSR